jgi:hypothetical protein
MKSLRALVLCSISCLTGCQQAWLDGAWTGRLECDDSLFDIDAALDQSLETEEVTGSFFIEYVVDLGLLGQYRSWSKGRVDDAEYDAAEGSVAGRIFGIDDDNSNQAPDWKFDLALNEQNDELAGELERLDGDGNVVVTCSAELSAAADTGN